MGSDLICLLDIFIVSNPSGVIVVRTADLDPPQIYTCIKYNAASLLYAYEWKLCISVVTSINIDLADETHSVTLRTDTTCIHPEDLHCTANKHKGRDADFENRWFRESCEESCVKANLTLSCMFCIEHRCAVSVVLLKPENKSPSQVPSQMFRGCFPFFLMFLVHTHKSCCQNTKMMNGKIWERGKNLIKD